MKPRLLSLILLFSILSLLPMPAVQAQTDNAQNSPPAWLGEPSPEGAYDLPPDSDWVNLPVTAFSDPAVSLPTTAALQAVSGLAHTCVLTETGGVKCWGDNSEGKLGNGSIVNSFLPVDVDGLGGSVMSISGTHKHTCALTSTGGMLCWGRNWHGELGDGTTDYQVSPVTPVGLASGVKAIAAGGFHTCALMFDGTVRCWGANWHGQIGDGTTLERHTPVQVIDLGGKATAIAAGKYHTCAILETTGLRCWGYNKFGQIGAGPDSDALFPKQVSGLKQNVADVSLGENHSCALLIQNQVMCWGNNQQGQIGIGNIETQYIPVFVTGMGSNASSINAGQRFTCARAITGEVYCWGENWAGQLGDGTQINRLVPTLAVELENLVSSIAAGDSYACAVLNSGSLSCWGSNSHGQLGDGSAAIKTTPEDVYGAFSGFTSVTSGGYHSCALTELGAVKCWGNNQYGQIGDDTYLTRIAPVQVYGLAQGVMAVAAGGFHTCAMTASQVFCWGDNSYGQLGNATRISSKVPVAVIGINHPPVKLTAGTNHTCAILDNGVIKCWGYNRNGQLGDGEREDSTTATVVEGVDGIDFSQVSAGDRHTCAVATAGNAYCWGFNGDGQLGNGTNINSDLPVAVSGLDQKAVDIALGIAHTCTLMQDMTLRCWGNNLYGQLGDGTTNEHWLPVVTRGLGGIVSDLTAGGYQTCARLSASDEAQCWGYNQSGQLGDGTTFTRLLPVSVPGLNAAEITAGSQTTCAVTSPQSVEGAGSLKCWGNNTWGQIGNNLLPWSLTPVPVSALVTASLEINHPIGAPGSFFSVAGRNFSSNTVVEILINNQPISTKLMTSSLGEVSFVLDTATADPGGYVVTVRAGKTQNVSFHLDLEATQHTQEDDWPVFLVPAGIALTWTSYLPWGAK